MKTETEIKEYINQHDDALITLKAFQDWNLISRTFMLNEHSKMIPKLKSGTEEYIDTPQNMRTFLLSRIYLELFERLCQSIEDLTTMLYALQKNLKDFNINITKTQNPKNILDKLTREKWYEIFHYSSLEELENSPSEKKIITDIRKKNFESLENLRECLIHFIDVYWVSFTKIKHGNTLVYGVEQTCINGVDTIIVPVIYNSKNKDNQMIIALTDDVYSSWQKLFKVVIMLSKSLMEIAIQHIETGGLEFIVNETIYFPVSDEERLEIEGILQKYFKLPIRFEVKTSLAIEITEPTWKKHFELQKKIHTLLG